MVSAYQPQNQETNRESAKRILDAARTFRQFEQWSYGDSIQAARDLKLPWVEIGQQLGVSDKTAREIHKKYLRGEFPVPTTQDEDGDDA